MPLLKIGDIPCELAQKTAEGLSRAYDEFVENEDGGRSSRKPGIHASELGCPRKVVYSLLGTEKHGKIKRFWRQRFQFGKYAHQMIQDDFARMAAASNGAMTFEAEVPISGDLQELAREFSLESACDGVFTFFDKFSAPFLRIGLEIKTESPSEYEKLTAPKPDHVRQAHVYMKVLDLPMMWFMYINKGNQNNTASVKPFLVDFDPTIWAGLELEFRDRLEEAALGQLPEGKESIVCEFCSYAWTCQPAILNKNKVKATLRRPV